MVRLAAGRFKGMVLKTPSAIRATEAKVRQALFNILGSFVEGARVVDGFAGSGSLGFEALSRGAGHVAFIESDTDAVMCIRETLDRLAHELGREEWRLLHLEAERGLRELAASEPPFDLIMLDPPYRSEEGKKALNTVVDCAILAPTGLVVVEHDRRMSYPAAVGSLTQGPQHRYGDTVLSFYRAAGLQEP